MSRVDLVFLEPFEEPADRRGSLCEGAGPCEEEDEAAGRVNFDSPAQQSNTRRGGSDAKGLPIKSPWPAFRGGAQRTASAGYSKCAKVWLG
jgi:hypothetical protein